jgi:hypothetical protein
LLPFNPEPLPSRLLYKNVKIRIYKSIILPVVLYGHESWSLTLRKENRWGCLRRGCWGEYFDQRGMKWRETGEEYIMRSFITCTLHQIWLELSRIIPNIFGNSGVAAQPATSQDGLSSLELLSVLFICGCLDCISHL